MDVFMVILPDEIRQNMSLEVVDLHQRPVKCYGQPFRERRAYKQGSQQPGAPCEGYGRDILRPDAGPVDGLADHRHDIQLVCPGCKFGYNPAVSLVDFLAGQYVRKKIAVTDDSCGSIVT